MFQELFFVLVSFFICYHSGAQAQSNRPAIVWQKCFGGLGNDKANDVLITADGGVLVVGNSSSNDGDLTSHNGSTDSTDGWVIKLDADANIQWQQSLGGTGDDDFTSVVAGNDGNYYCIGNTNSAGGDDLPNPYWKKIWVVKLSTTGNVVWSKTYQAHWDNRTVFGLAISDGNIVISTPQFVAKINTAGDVLWELGMGAGNIIENSNHQLITSTGYGIDIATGDTTNLHWQFPPGSYTTSIVHAGNGLLMAYNQQENNDFCFDGGGTYTGINMVNKVGFFTGNNMDEMVSEQWYISYCPDGGRYGGPSVGAAPMHGLAAIPGISFIAAGGISYVYWEPKSQACIYTGGVFSLYGAPLEELNWSEFRSVKVYPSGNEFICVGYTNADGGDVSGIHGWPGMFSNDFWVVKLSTLNTIRGNVFLDLNNNNIKDSGEPNFNEVKVNSVSANTNTQVKPFDGHYSIAADRGTYKTYVSLPGNLYYSVYPDTATSAFTFPGSIDTIDFAIHKMADARDYSVSLTALSPVRPGFDVLYKINYANNGTDTLQNKTVQCIKDSRFTLGQTLPLYSNVSGDTITWNISSLLPGNGGEILINITAALPGEVNIGDSMVSFVSLESMGDVNPADNMDSVTQLVTGSFDPNDKQEAHNGFISLLEVQNAHYLYYTIRFQNTGNDTAFNIIVRDALDDKLDWGTFEMTGASHGYQLKIKAGRYLEWKFDNILLVDSVHNEAASHGYISYRIKPKTNLVAGDVINNAASIYFDFNAAIETNIQKTLVVKTRAIWTGAVDTLWENAANWNINAVPDAETLVTIPANVPNFPVINSPAFCFAIKVEKNAAITINDGYELKITGK